MQYAVVTEKQRKSLEYIRRKKTEIGKYLVYNV